MLILQRLLAISFLLSRLITFVGPLRKIRRKKLKEFLLASGNSIFIQPLKGRFLTTAHAQRARRYNASIIFPWFSPDWISSFRHVICLCCQVGIEKQTSYYLDIYPGPLFYLWIMDQKGTKVEIIETEISRTKRFQFWPIVG